LNDPKRSGAIPNENGNHLGKAITGDRLKSQLDAAVAVTVTGDLAAFRPEGMKESLPARFLSPDAETCLDSRNGARTQRQPPERR
jgi:hypothetical protein